MMADVGNILDMGSTNIEKEAVERTYKKSFNWKIKHVEKFPDEYTFSTRLEFRTFPPTMNISFSKQLLGGSISRILWIEV